MANDIIYLRAIVEFTGPGEKLAIVEFTGPAEKFFYFYLN
jgi:hypothetical protein